MGFINNHVIECLESKFFQSLSDALNRSADHSVLVMVVADTVLPDTWIRLRPELAEAVAILRDLRQPVPSVVLHRGELADADLLALDPTRPGFDSARRATPMGNNGDAAAPPRKAITAPPTATGRAWDAPTAVRCTRVRPRARCVDWSVCTSC